MCAGGEGEKVREACILGKYGDNKQEISNQRANIYFHIYFIEVLSVSGDKTRCLNDCGILSHSHFIKDYTKIFFRTTYDISPLNFQLLHNLPQ